MSTGVAWNAPYIGVAAASYWLMGGKPRISSIVRSIPEVVYSVLSTVAPPHVRRHHQGHRAVRVDVVGPVLRVVLEHEDRRLLPEAALRDGLHQPAQGEVVLRDHRARRRVPGCVPDGVVVAEAEDGEGGQVAVLLELRELLQPGVDALVVGDARGRRAGRSGSRGP